ncbi:MAG: hypothetical protein KDJ65_31715 [Anaerolineae bacterium]|nr:hypothetical protein [Anaerolineae bacterium]
MWAAFDTFNTLYLAEQVAQEINHHVNLSHFDTLKKCNYHIHSVSKSQIETYEVNRSDKLNLQQADLATLILALELAPDLVLTDDLALRKAIEQQNLTPMGSVGILLRAFKTNVIDEQTLTQAIDDLFVHSTLYLSPQFKSYVKKLIAQATQQESSNG